MSNVYWWRSWHGAPTDLKWPVIAARAGVKVGIVSAVAWALMDYASQQPERGSVEGFDAEEYSVYSGFTENEITAVIQAMTEKRIVVDGKLKNWEKRQPKREDETVTERVRKHREMKRDETQVTHGNAPELRGQITELRGQSREGETLPEPDPPDRFDAIQRWGELNGIISTGERDVKAIQALEKSPVTKDDIDSACQWYTSENKRAPTYWSNILGPIRKAMADRLQTASAIEKKPIYSEEY